MRRDAELVDQRVRDEIRTALDKNMCVEAGAGTGKTTSLVARIVELLASGRCDADSLAVITFTEKAAAELSARVRERIEEARGEEVDEVRRDRLDRATRALYRARVETIHTFAANLLRERPVEAAIDPGFAVLSDLEARLAFDSAYEAWLDELMAGDHPEIERALNVGFGLDEIRQTADIVHRYRFLLPLAPYDPLEPDARAVVDWLEEHVDELRSIEASCIDEEDRGLPGLQSLIRFAERCSKEGTSDRARERLVALASPQPGRTKGRQTSWDDPADCKRMKTLVDEYRDLRDRICEELRTAALLAVLPHVEGFVRDYEQRRRDDGVADFDDLLIWARDLVRDRPEVRRYFQTRYRCVLIDEFQDTDPIQIEIASYLTSEEDGSDGWRSLLPTPGRLFVVGDPKQSIYRFRRADIAIYDEVKRGLLGGRVRTIRQNFRSVPGVLDWVNGVFDALFEEVEGIQPGNVTLEPAPDAPANGRQPVVVIRSDESPEKADHLRSVESEAISAVLHRAIQEERWPVRDQATGELRDPQWRDAAILLPARTGIETYEEALASAGIPFRHEGSRDYFRRQEVRELIHILRAIDDPTDRYSLVGALRSSAFGCSDEDLVVHLGSGGAFDYRPSVDSESPAVQEAFSVLRSLHYARGRTSLPELVRRTIDESRFVEVALMFPDGPQAAANLLAIADQARGFSSAGGGGLRAFARWLVDSTENESAEVDAGIAEETDDVVRLLTMHGAKGLEFPIVVTANLASTSPAHREPVPDEAERQVHFQVGSGGRNGHYATPEYDEHWEGEKAARGAEQIRLLYVATTRARDYLVVPAIRGRKKPGPYLSVLEPHLPGGADGGGDGDGALVMAPEDLAAPPDIEEDSAPTPDATSVERALSERESWPEERAALVRAARRELPIKVASSVERSVRPLAAEASHSGSTLLLAEGPPLPVGDALHLVMERVSFPDAADLEEVVTGVCAEAGLLTRQDEVLEMAHRCLASPTVRRALESSSYHREVPFTVPADGGFVTGRVDLVFREDGELVVVDYKTDEVTAEACEEHAREHHSGQAEIYARAIGAATGSPVGRVVFVFCRPGLEVTLSP